MNRSIRTYVTLAILASAAFAATARADEGMWLLNNPPTKTLKDKYGFEPSPEWLEHLQKAAVRIGHGGSGSVVSANGLVMTNHHVGSDMLEKLSTSQRDLLKTGFYAPTASEELKCPDLEVNILWSAEDVTQRINAGVTEDMPPADAFAQRRKAIATIEQESKQATGLTSEVVTLYHGARYHLYRYRAFTDIRLVFAPEQQIAFYGGDTDNFEYPRFDLDMCFFRIYEDGKPFKPEHYLRWSKNGAADGELTFILGHPGRTQRLFTVDHLRFLRDVDFTSIMRKLWRREVQLTTFSGRSDENARVAAGDYYNVANSRKAFTGLLAGLQDPRLLARKEDAEKQLTEAVKANPDYQKKWGDAWAQVAAAQKAYREFHERYNALEGRRMVLRSDLFRIARRLVRLAEEKGKRNEDRLEGYRDSDMASLELELYSPAPIYDDLEIERLTSGLAYLCEAFGGEDPLAARALTARSPRDQAEFLVRNTKLKDVAFRKEIAAGGTVAIASSSDAMIRFAAMVEPDSRMLIRRYEDEVQSVERDAYAKIAAAQFAINGENMYPDATFTLRLAFGPVKGYREDGRDVPPFTTFAGLYQRARERHNKPPFDLPARWVERKDKLNLDTPFNFVTTADIIGGNSGSPVVNRDGEVVGLVFDGNIQGLILDIAYTEEQARAVSVDSRGIIEALRSVYDANELLKELTSP